MSLSRLFFMGDVHVPFEDKRAVRLTLAALADFKADVFVSLGDLMDLSSVSHWSKDPDRALDLEDEATAARKLLDEIEERTPGARRIYVAGNHEDRLKRFLQDKAPQFFRTLDVPSLLRLKERGWEYVPYKQSTQVGKLHITHDVGSAGRYNVYKALDTFQSPIVTGHTHRLGYVVEGDATGGSHVSAQFGWLGDIEQVDYLHRVKARRDWTLGFGYGYVEARTGYAYLIPVPIVNGTCVVEGRLYKVPRLRPLRAA